MRYASLLPVAGYFSEAEKIFESYRPDSLTVALRDDYYRAGNQLYFYAVRSVSNIDEVNAYARKGATYTDSLLKYLAPGTPEHLFYSAQQHILNKNMTLALADISDLLAQADDESEIFAIASTMAAYYYSRDRQPSIAKPSFLRFLLLPTLRAVGTK